jgi:hypothetical protein
MSETKTPDPFDGVGGAYVVDKKTGERKREAPVPETTATPKPERTRRPTEKQE